MHKNVYRDIFRRESLRCWWPGIFFLSYFNILRFILKVKNWLKGNKYIYSSDLNNSIALTSIYLLSANKWGKTISVVSKNII